MPGEPIPLMVTVKPPFVEEVQVRLDVPVPLAVNATLVEVNGLQERPSGTASLRETVPT